MKQTAKEVFDSKYEIYRNLENKPKIPLEARQMIFDTMEEYASQLKETKEVESFEEYIKESRNEFARVVLHYDPSEHVTLRTECDNLIIAYDQMADRLFSTPALPDEGECDHRYYTEDGRYMLYEDFCEKCGMYLDSETGEAIPNSKPYQIKKR